MGFTDTFWKYLGQEQLEYSVPPRQELPDKAGGIVTKIEV